MKHSIRNNVLQMRESHPANERGEKSREIMKRLLSLDDFSDAITVMLYVSIKGEVETREIIRDCLSIGKKVAVPIADKENRTLSVAEIKSLEDLREGSFSILEPSEDFVRLLNPEEVDVVIVPGIAFDRKGNRIGYGFGYYDNFLKTVRPDCRIIALAYELQIVEDVPVDSNDVKIGKIVTEKRVIDCSQPSSS